MTQELVSRLTDPSMIVAMLVAVSVFATLYTLVSPYFANEDLYRRMRAISVERDQIRAREKARANAEASNRKGSLRSENNQSIGKVVERFNLRSVLADESTVRKLKTAGFRSQNAMNIFLFCRFVLPMIFLAIGALVVFGFGYLEDKGFTIQVMAVLASGYFGFYIPNLYVSNVATKRQLSIKRAWPDGLDLMLICVESGVSIEAAMRRVSEEMVEQSPELAEEMVLTTAELSFLQERRAAYENLGLRTQLDAVKSVMQALIQAERYGTSIAVALRVLAQQSRDDRMADAEKKAAALPPKLTVPMIVFFVPVILAVLLGSAIIQAYAFAKSG